MEKAMVEIAIEGRSDSVAMESLKRAREKAGVTHIKKFVSRSSTAKTTKTGKPADGKKLLAKWRVLLSRTENDIKEINKRIKEIESEIEKASRDIGPFSMTVRLKRNELMKEQEKIKKLETVCATCRKELGK